MSDFTTDYLPNLVEIQHSSFRSFLETGLIEELELFFPLTDYSEKWELQVSADQYRIAPPQYKEQEAKQKRLNYEAKVYVPITVKNVKTEETEETEIFLFNLPLMTERGTFIINGTEKVIINQMVRSPNIYYEYNKQEGKYSATLVPNQGQYIIIENDKRNRIWVGKGSKKISLHLFLKALGLENEKIQQSLTASEDYKKIFDPEIEKLTHEEALLKWYKIIYPSRRSRFKEAQNKFQFRYENIKLGRVGRYKLDQKLGHTSNLDIQLTKHDLLAIVEYFLKFQKGEVSEDDENHLGNRRLRSVGELLQGEVRSGLRQAKRGIFKPFSNSNEETLYKKMSGINFQALNKTISKFFSSSKLSQFMEQTNPLAELTHKRRITALEPKRDLREIYPSHYGRLCPIQTPEGQNGGLTNALALYARVNEFGFITTPYFPVDDEGKVLRDRAPDYLTADEEDEYRLATADIPTNEEGKIETEEVPIRYGQEFTTVPPEEVDYLAVSPLQFASVSTSLIPFLEHNDGTRALMGANMQGQALPLLRPERPLVGTGLEAQLARYSGQLLLSDTHGVIDYVDSSLVRIKDQSGQIIEYPLQKYQPSNQETYFNQQPIVFRGEEVKPGQVLADASGTEEGEIAIGKNVLVAYMPWEGYNYEDAIVISDRLVQEDVYTSIHVEKYDLNVYSKNEYEKREKITRQLPKVSEEALKQLDKEGIICVGAWVEAGDILVGKESPISTSRKDPVYNFLSKDSRDDLDDIIDKSLRVPESVRGRVVHVEVLSREQGDELPNGTEMLVRCYVAQARKIKVGDKLVGRHGNKGIVSRILPQADMPFLPDGRPIDIILNPLGVPSRMNVGQIFECLLGLAAENLNARFQVTPFDEMYGEQKSHDTVEEKLKQAAARPGKEWIYNHQHPQQLEIYDGRTGERFDRPVTVGQAYMLKLSHLADNKIHARSTGPYNRVTQQPVAGKANNGGQRFGDMEVWALEAHGAAHTLQELFTIKSDDMQGRKKARKAIIRGQSLPKPSRPEAFNVLMRELEALGFNLSVNKDQNNSNRVSEVKIELASPETIKSWSKFELLNGLILKGEVTDSKGYKNNKSTPNGLFSEEIFGKFKQDRRQRMGYIDLGTPVVHVWYQKTLRVLLEMKETDIKEIIYYNAYVVINRGESYKQVLSYEEKEQQEEQENLEIRTGAEAILRLLQELDLQEEKAKIEEQLKEEGNKQTRDKLNKRLRIINYFISTETSPEWMLVHNIPVLPPELRPVITLEGGTPSSSDLNWLYQNIIERNNRLVKFQERGVIPEIILNKEKRELQKEVDALIKNGSNGNSLKDRSGRSLKSLSDIIKGKEGRFRSNLLGKRVDYSGRSIIIIGPNLKIDQCGLPKKMAIELFQPFVIHKLIQQDNNGIHTIEEAKRKLAHPDAEVWKALEEVVQYHPVLLNRAPTLHRLGIQAFKPILVEGEAIQLHPLVCAGFNADFDGDQMAVHVPLSPEAQAEAWHLMLGNRNLLSPATGEPIVTPSQDMVLGCYYLTAENPQVQPQDQKYYANLEDVLRAYEQGYLDIHTDVWVRFEGKVKSSQETNFLDIETQEVSKQYIQTTPGRIIYNQVLTALEAEPKIFCNHLVEKKQLKELIAWAFSHYGSRKCAILIDKIKEIGFRYATQSGISICLKDLQIDPSIKQRLLEEGEEKENQLPVEQRSNEKITKIWEEISKKVENQINPYFRDNDPLNSIYIMSKSGARGGPSQVRQLVGMRGIMANSQGENIPLPVKKNFQEGLGVSEYLISSYGTRKGIIDTALRTADSGDLTRRLITASQDVVVREEDCGTEQGIELTSLKNEKKEVLIPLQDRLLGRTLAANVIDPQTQEVIAERNQEVDQALAEKIGDKVETVYVRSPLTCETSGGVCQHCYGWSLAHHHQVSQGEAVGVIAAQSASEPTTQMTLRTFHTGGAAEKGGDIVQGFPRLKKLLEASEPQSPCMLAQHSGEVKIEDKGNKVKISVVDAEGAIASNKPIKREQWLEEGKHNLEGDHVEIATPLTKGVINPNELLDVYFQHYLKEHNRYQASLLSFGKVQQFLISEVQKVYQDQKIDVADKHIEVIVRQMTSKVEIENGGNSNWLAGDLVKLEELKTSQDDSIQYKPVLLGVRKASINAESFLNAASFQETESILTEAALQQKTDNLQGLKENAMVGNLIPAGTGFDPSY